jgi:DNA-binding transcriptional MerR regulator
VEKGPDAFRTISEVAEDLDLPQHVLRFWETRFPQIRPLKRGGGRRYYRPDDVELLRGIRHLLYSEGYTIRGVQRILKEEGPRYVQAIWRDVEAEEFAASELDAADRPAERRPARDPVDSGHPGRGRDAEPAPRSGPLSGLLNLLPSRQRDVAEDPASSRRANPNAKLRRAPDSEPGFLELPLLPDLAPQSRPTRAEPPSEPQRSEPVRRREPEVAPPEVRRAEVPPVPLRPAEPRPNFPFRAVAPEPAREDGYDQYDEEFEPEPPAQFPPEPVPAARPVVLRPVEEPIARVAEPAASAPSRVQPLSPNDIQRLQATLYELQECRRLLDAARE